MTLVTPNSDQYGVGVDIGKTVQVEVGAKGVTLEIENQVCCTSSFTALAAWFSGVFSAIGAGIVSIVNQLKW